MLHFSKLLKRKADMGAPYRESGKAESRADCELSEWAVEGAEQRRGALSILRRVGHT